jgi:flagellar motor switch protein FliG
MNKCVLKSSYLQSSATVDAGSNLDDLALMPLLIILAYEDKSVKQHKNKTVLLGKIINFLMTVSPSLAVPVWTLLENNEQKEIIEWVYQDSGGGFLNLCRIIKNDLSIDLPQDIHDLFIRLSWYDKTDLQFFSNDILIKWISQCSNEELIAIIQTADSFLKDIVLSALPSKQKEVINALLEKQYPPLQLEIWGECALKRAIVINESENQSVHLDSFNQLPTKQKKILFKEPQLSAECEPSHCLFNLSMHIDPSLSVNCLISSIKKELDKENISNASISNLISMNSLIGVLEIFSNDMLQLIFSKRISLLISLISYALDHIELTQDNTVPEFFFSLIEPLNNIVSVFPIETRKEIVDKLKLLNPEMMKNIGSSGFEPFESIIELSDRMIQTWLREVSSDQLIIALSGDDIDEITHRILNNMSGRAAEMLQEDLLESNPGTEQIQQARYEILSILRWVVANEEAEQEKIFRNNYASIKMIEPPDLKLLLNLTHKQTKEWVDQTSAEHLLDALSSIKWKPLRKKVYKALSKRAREMFADDLANYPVISDKQINMAQRILTYNAMQVKPASWYEKLMNNISL